MSDLKKVLVTWVDSAGTAHWDDIKEAEELEPVICETIGFLVKETKDYITVVQSYANQEGVMHALSIPKVAVTKKKFIK